MKKVNEVMARFWIWVLGCFYGTSIRTRERFGAVIAWILWWAIPKRRHVALTNLRLCFPDWTEEKRVRIAKQNYQYGPRGSGSRGALEGDEGRAPGDGEV